MSLSTNYCIANIAFLTSPSVIQHSQNRITIAILKGKQNNNYISNMCKNENKNYINLFLAIIRMKSNNICYHVLLLLSALFIEIVSYPH